MTLANQPSFGTVVLKWVNPTEEGRGTRKDLSKRRKGKEVERLGARFTTKTRKPTNKTIPRGRRQLEVLVMKTRITLNIPD